MLQSVQKYGKMLTVQDGFLICPVCKRNKRLQRIDVSTQGKAVPLFCRSCKNEILVDIENGQCFESRS